MTEHTLPALLEHLAAESADATALIDGEQQTSFAELASRSATIAGGLQHAGVQPGDRVGVCLPNSAYWLELQFALARIGAIMVGINARYRQSEVTQILAAAGARFLAAEAPLAGCVPLRREQLLRGEPAEAGTVHENTPSNVFTSSGSTATPKLILHSQGGIVRHSLAVAKAYHYTDPDTVVFGLLPLCGVWGFNTAMAALAAGRPVVLAPRFEPDDAVAAIERYRITHTNGPDQLLRKLVATSGPPSRIASLREFGFATFSNDSAELVAMGDRLGKTFFQLYGSSEVQALMMRQPSEASSAQRAEPGGTPVNPQTQVRVRDVDSGELVTDGGTGELEVAGPNRMLGYLTDGGIRLDTSTITEDGWARTGDLAALTPAGIRYVSRRTDVLRLSGFLVDPREIESALEEMAVVREAQVVEVRTETGQHRAIAFVLAGAAFDEQDVLHRCRERMASYKVPLRVVTLEEFPTVDGANGPRIQRKALRDKANAVLAEREGAV